MAFLALRAGNLGVIFVQIFRVFAFRVAGAGQESAEAAGADDHRPAADIAGNIGRGGGNLAFLNFGVFFREVFFERLVKFLHHRLPGGLPFGDFIEFFFHLRGKLNIHDLREVLDQ